MRLAAAALAALLPGAWIAFGLRLPGFPFGARLLTAISLAPVVLPVQLYALRFLGVPFESAAVILAVGTDAIRDRTPRSAIVVLDEDPGVHFPTLTRRKLYVPPPQERPQHPGVGEKSEDMLKIVKGYDSRVLQERRGVVATLFGGGDDSSRAAALARILALGRPVVVVFTQARHRAVARWLEEGVGARRVYSDSDGSVWLVGPAPVAPAP